MERSQRVWISTRAMPIHCTRNATANGARAPQVSGRVSGVTPRSSRGSCILRSEAARVRRVAFCGYLGSGNIGNDATLESVVDWLNSITRRWKWLHQHRTSRRSCQVRYPFHADDLAFAKRERQGVSRGRSAGFSAGPSISAAVTRWLAPWTRSSFLHGWYSRSGFGVAALGFTLQDLFSWLRACRLRRSARLLLDVGAERACESRNARGGCTWLRPPLAAHVSYRDALAPQLAMARAGASRARRRWPDSFAVRASRPGACLAKPEPGRIVVGVMALLREGDGS